MNLMDANVPSTLSQLVDVLEKFDEGDRTILLKELKKNLLLKKLKLIDKKISKSNLPKLSQQEIADLCRQVRKFL